MKLQDKRADLEKEGMPRRIENAVNKSRDAIVGMFANKK